MDRACRPRRRSGYRACQAFAGSYVTRPARAASLCSFASVGWTSFSPGACHVGVSLSRILRHCGCKSDPSEHNGHQLRRRSLDREAVYYAIVGDDAPDRLTFLCGASGYVCCPPRLQVVATELVFTGRAVACCAGGRTRVGSEATGTGTTCNRASSTQRA